MQNRQQQKELHKEDKDINYKSLQLSITMDFKTKQAGTSPLSLP